MKRKGCLIYEKKEEFPSEIPPSGKKGIRTLGTRKSTTVFETAPIDHSGIFPFKAVFRHRPYSEVLIYFCKDV